MPVELLQGPSWNLLSQLACSGRGYESLMTGTRNLVVFADGRSRSISEEIDQTVLRALLTADGGEEVPSLYH